MCLTFNYPHVCFSLLTDHLKSWFLSTSWNGFPLFLHLFFTFNFKQQQIFICFWSVRIFNEMWEGGRNIKFNLIQEKILLRLQSCWKFDEFVVHFYLNLNNTSNGKIFQEIALTKKSLKIHFYKNFPFSCSFVTKFETRHSSTWMWMTHKRWTVIPSSPRKLPVFPQNWIPQ